MRKALWCLFPLWVAMSPPVVAQVPDEWKHTAYAYEASQTDLAKVLEDFTSALGVKLDIDPQVTGIVDGRMRADSPQAFLDRLGLEHKFQWFVYNNTLYVSPLSEQTSVRLEVSPDAVDDLQKALTDVGLLDSRFGWGILPDEGVVLVRGPKRYVDMVREYSQKVETPDEKQDIISLPLHYANAADRTIRYRDQQLTVAGVASILQGLLESRSRGESINGVTMMNPGMSGGTAGGVMGGAGASPLASLGSGGMDMDSITAGADALLAQTTGSHHSKGGGGESSRGGKIRVEADVRNNAVLIYDLPKRRAIYQKLIAELDVPRNLVEIDAIILDINRDKLAELSSNWNFKAGSFSGGGGLMPAGATSTLFIQDYGKFAADLHALEGNGSASVISNPSILTLENQPAVIDFSQTEYLTATGERVADILPITAGTSLQVIPRTLSQGGKKEIQMVVDIEDGQIETSEIQDTQPSVRRGNVSTQAVIAEQGSLVIGGFHSNENRDSVHKIPLLGDIPYIGKLLFRSTTHNITQRERLFILTPRLIGDQVDPARYVVNGNPHDLDAAAQTIKDRRKGLEAVTRGDVQAALSGLASGQVPKGFSAATGLPFVANTLCDTQRDGIPLDNLRSQWYSHGDWGVAVVLAKNTTNQRVRIDESLCGGRWVLGVGAWPHAWLAPGERSEIFIAMRQPANLEPDAHARASLLDMDDPTPPAVPAAPGARP